MFQLRLDRLHVLRLPYPDIIFSVIGASTPTLAVIAFKSVWRLRHVGCNTLCMCVSSRLARRMPIGRRSNGVYSAPAYLANGSNNTEIWGAGFTVSLALLIRFGRCDAVLC